MLSQSMIRKIVGAGIGAAAALLMLWIGFWKTLLICVLACIGWWLAGSRKIPEPVESLLEKVFHLR